MDLQPPVEFLLGCAMDFFGGVHTVENLAGPKTTSMSGAQIPFNDTFDAGQYAAKILNIGQDVFVYWPLYSSSSLSSASTPASTGKSVQRIDFSVGRFTA